MDKKIPPHKEAALNEINDHYKGNSAKQQCLRLLAALTQFKINSFEASRGLSIYDPRARIMQLRRAGNVIDTVWEYVVDEKGASHRVGCYVLRASMGNGDLSNAYLLCKSNAIAAGAGNPCEVAL